MLKLIVPLLCMSLFVYWIFWANKSVVLNKITVKSSKLPDSFVGYKIAHISDVHNTDLGNDNQRIIDILTKEKPDIIAITGDVLDTRRGGFKVSLSLAERMAKIAPCYFIPGNHEAKSSQYLELKKELKKAGVILLEDSKTVLEVNGDKINLMGICDPLRKTAALNGDSDTVTLQRLQLLSIDPSSFNILLSHRPEYFNLYTEFGLDLVLSGHAHGGQVRLPFIGGLYAPNQGLFPKYDSGLYTKENTNMVVSRGLGKSIIPIRFNNRPEVIIIELGK